MLILPEYKLYGLYCTCHPESGYRYIGQTFKSINVRFSSHKSSARIGKNLPVYRWMNKHGLENINYEVLEYALTSNHLDELEIAWISMLRLLGLADLNIADGGLHGIRGYPGHKHTDETRAKISRSKTGVKKIPMSEEAKQNVGKLTWSEVERIREFPDTITNRELAIKFHVTASNISCIRLRKTWIR